MPQKTRVILITGCSSGFGLLIASRLAASGHHVHATIRDPLKKNDLESEAARREARQNLFIHLMDVRDTPSIRTVVAQILAEEGRIDILINNAGFGMGGFFEDLSEQDWKDQFDTNFFGVLNVTREVLPSMRDRRQGRIINISSVSAFSGSPSLSAYASSKWALEGFSECLFMELTPFNIDVVLVEPGSYKTKIFTENARYARNFFDEKSPYSGMSRSLKAFVDRHVRSSKRDPEEVACVVEKLVDAASPRFRNVIGLPSKLRCWIARHIPFKCYARMVTALLFRKIKNDHD